MTIVKANGIDFAYDDFGDEADETILLIVGLGTQMIRWTVPFYEALAACGYRVIRFGQPGRRPLDAFPPVLPARFRLTGGRAESRTAARGSLYAP
jgi:pimeloyl-ACP methyl ester carboxylesterase